jgi:hypothetical protein
MEIVLKIGDKVKIQYGNNFENPHWIIGTLEKFSKTRKYGFIRTTSKRGRNYLLKRKENQIFLAFKHE